MAILFIVVVLKKNADYDMINQVIMGWSVHPHSMPVCAAKRAEKSA